MKTISLNGTWQLRGKNQLEDDGEIISIPATVPGCVQLDLSKNGYLPEDLYMGFNVTKTEEYEDYEWWYERTFTAPEERKNVFLVFGAVDCMAEYFLNDIKIGESDNMFIEQEFQIDNYLVPGENRLCVHIKSPVHAANDEDFCFKTLNAALGLNTEARYIRKAPHSYGWDIMPRLVTSGLWRDVKIEVRDSIYVKQTLFQYNPTYGNVKFVYVLGGDDKDFRDVEIEVSGSCGEDSKFSRKINTKRKMGGMVFTIPNTKLWWPYGYGEPNMYDGTIKIYSKGELVHEEPFSFGARRIGFDRFQPINENTDGRFRITVNGVEIMCKGSNWVPLDALHCRDAERYDRALSLVKDIGCNILRCWGGNVYEDHEFFDFCDRNGIMVWQDFAMACAQYPEDETFKRRMTEEATSVVRKLRNHPSLVIWCGDNECDQICSYVYPGGNSITLDVIPKVIELNDIDRPYLPSSPYIPKELAITRRKVPLVEDHLWGPRDYYKSDYYTTNTASFVSEAGFLGCPSLESIKKFITPENVWPYNNDEWILHSTDCHGNNWRVVLMESNVRQLFGEVPEDPEDFILASQINQAEAKKYLIERMRVDRPKKTGIIWWNLLDGWPQMSDAIVDYYFTKKLAYSYVKVSQAPFTICADEIKSGYLNIFACNDTLETKRGTLTVKDALTDEVITTCDFVARENASTKIAFLPALYSDKKFLVFEWKIGDECGFNHHLNAFPPISLSMYKEFLNKYYKEG